MEQRVSGSEALELSGEELMLVRLSCSLAAEDESPLGALEKSPAPERLESSARSLVKRGLADRRSFRPHREILRRILVVAQPDARVVLLAIHAGTAERTLDVYERARSFVSYGRHGDRFRFGPPLELVDLLDEISQRFVPRRSTGDFIQLELDAAEYFVFSTAAKALALERMRRGDGRVHSTRPESALADASLDGAVLLPGKRARFVPGGGSDGSTQIPVPAEADWSGALESLVRRGILNAHDDGYQLRPFLHDLALGLVQRTRYVLTRFDFGAPDWIVRDAILVPVPGSLFLLKPTPSGGLSIKELNPEGLQKALSGAVDALGA